MDSDGNPAQALANITTNLTFNVPNLYTGRTVINEGIVQIVRESDLGLNPSSFKADQLTINGGRLRATANLVFNDPNRGITLGTAGGNFAVANNVMLTIAETNPINAVGKLTFLADANNLGSC